MHRVRPGVPLLTPSLPLQGGVWAVPPRNGDNDKLTPVPGCRCLRTVSTICILPQVYGRMRLCRTMVQDHFTPAYLRSMRAAVASFEADYAGFGPRRQADAS